MNTNKILMRRYSFLVLVIFFLGCATSSNIDENRFIGIYESSDDSKERFILNFDDGLYRIQYNSPELVWEGVGYERNNKILAVLRPTMAEGDAEFLNISFPGDNQLFVVARNLEGGYVRDEYFTKAN